MKAYWSCSKLADKIRGTKSLGCGTSEEWDKWHNDAKEAHPVRYWIADTLLDKIQDFVYFIPDKCNKIRYWLNNRFRNHTHALTAHKSSLPRGQWCDLSNRFLPCMFDELVNFVEVEKAGMQAISSEETIKKYNVPLTRQKWYLRFLTEWRCPQAGIDYLNWEMTLVYDEDWGVQPNDEKYGQLTPQAVAAKEVLALYTWYTQVYKNRPDPYDVSGWSAICENARQSGKSIFSAINDDEKTDKALKTNRQLEAEYQDEDTEMMIRLIKVRDSLWT